MQLNTLRAQQKKRPTKRLGRGAGSGRGKTAGRGHKGAGQRKGRTHYIGFEGGNVPFLRKIPKRGFTPKRRRSFQIVNLKDIAGALTQKSQITPKELKEANLIRDVRKPVKILAGAGKKSSLKATIRAHAFSRNAISLIEAAGGKAECLSQ